MKLKMLISTKKHKLHKWQNLQLYIVRFSVLEILNDYKREILSPSNKNIECLK